MSTAQNEATTTRLEYPNGPLRDAATLIVYTPPFRQHPALEFKEGIGCLVVELVDGWRWSTSEHLLVCGLQMIANGLPPRFQPGVLDEDCESALAGATEILMAPVRHPVLPGMLVTASRTLRFGEAGQSTGYGLVTAVRESPDGIAPTVVVADLVTGESVVWRLHECTPVTDPAKVKAAAVQAGDVHGDQPDVEAGYDDDALSGSAFVEVAGAGVRVVDLDVHDADELREVAALFDKVADAASEVADDVREAAGRVCPDCRGYGCRVVEERPCSGCGGNGYIL